MSTSRPTLSGATPERRPGRTAESRPVRNVAPDLSTTTRVRPVAGLHPPEVSR